MTDDRANLYAIDGLAARVGNSYNLRLVLMQPPPNEKKPRNLTGYTITPTIEDENGQEAPSNFTVALRKDTLGMFNLQLPSNHLLTEGLYSYSVEVGRPAMFDNETEFTGYLQVLRRVN